MAMIIS